MNVENLAKGLTYRGKAKGKRQAYYIFEGRGFYLNMSIQRADRKSGNFHVVEPAATEYVRKHFAGKTGVTGKDVFAAAHKAHHVAGSLEALNILYVLVGLGHARVDQRHKEKALYFNLN
jgi:hypothetical protein